MEVNRPTNTGSTTQHPENYPIGAYPTSDRPVLDTVLKEMLLFLKASLHSYLTAGINRCQGEVQALGGRVDHMEQKMGEYTSSFNTVVEAHASHGKEITWLRNKVANLEDRSRRKNLKIRGIPKTIPGTQLFQYKLYSPHSFQL